MDPYYQNGVDLSALRQEGGCSAAARRREEETGSPCLVAVTAQEIREFSSMILH